MLDGREKKLFLPGERVASLTREKGREELESSSLGNSEPSSFSSHSKKGEDEEGLVLPSEELSRFLRAREVRS